VVWPLPVKVDAKAGSQVWSSKYGKAKSFRVGGQFYVQFPVRKKPEQPAQGAGA
jgi:hypothetical protein